MEKVKWGILSTANIGVAKVIPAMQKGDYSEITAVASRDFNRAKDVAEKLRIPKVYGSYEELLEDTTIDAVYIPLPNHMHIKWSIKALEAGKHVLCEKPIGMNLDEAVKLRTEAKKYPDLKLMEAFMYRFHPQMEKTKELIEEGAIGEILSVQSMFAYHNVDPQNIRNIAEIGGGGLLDIGCYCISLSRFIFEGEPKTVSSLMEYDPQMKIDRLTSALMEFNNGTAQFTCSTQMFNNQFAEIVGTEGKISIRMPFTPTPDESTTIIYQKEKSINEIIFEPVDKYTIQGDLFSQAIINDTKVPTAFNDAVNNMKVIDKIKESAKRKKTIEIK